MLLDCKPNSNETLKEKSVSTPEVKLCMRSMDRTTGKCPLAWLSHDQRKLSSQPWRLAESSKPLCFPAPEAPASPDSAATSPWSWIGQNTFMAYSRWISPIVGHEYCRGRCAMNCEIAPCATAKINWCGDPIRPHMIIVVSEG